MLVLATSFLRQQLKPILADFPRLVVMREEYGANSVLTYTFSVAEVVKHPAVDRLFAQLSRRNKAPAKTLEEWQTLLIESYNRKYKRDDAACEVRFHVKGNVLFVNGTVASRDHIHHSVDIPYRWKDTGEPEEDDFAWPAVEAELTVRVLVLNGMLLLQVGYFSKEYSPKILRPGSLAIYETYATITSFPLMYFDIQHGIPARYLALVAEATPSYQASYVDRDTGKSSDKYKDWQVLTQEVGAYRVVCDSADRRWGEYDWDLVKKLQKRLEDRRQPLLDAEGYTTLESKSDDDWRWPDMGHTYWNRYSRVFFCNVNANRDSRHDDQWLGGYHEELP
jgi:hypothetical protein